MGFPEIVLDVSDLRLRLHQVQMDLLKGLLDPPSSATAS
jgi:hypothetical protein